MKIIYAALSFCMWLFFLDCSQPVKTTTAAKKGDTFIYEFSEESEGYTIKVTPRTIYLRIGTYDKTLASDTFAFPEARYDSFVTALSALHIVNRENIMNRCIGSASHSLQLYAGTGREVKGYRVSCGDEKFGNLAGDVAAAAALFNALIPDLYDRV
ncbi:MAG: hypothetical protein H7Y01_03765, partial [Ferruginibacter sp.]|nr:hypothetical protein [Chitinophagaceae bacterium]